MSLLKRTTIIWAGLAVLAAWLSAAMTPGRPPVVADSVAPGPIEDRGAALASEIARLHERLRPQDAPREPTRNPFAFRSTGRALSSTSTSSTAASVAAAAAQEAAVAASLSGPLALRLAGLAEESGDANVAPVRTAIISGSGQVFLAKEGDRVTDRDVVYAVGNISADSVELTDVRDGSTHRLTLK